MKNAGMAGAVALVGIGLLSTGTELPKSRFAAASISIPFTTTENSTQSQPECPAENSSWFEPSGTLLCVGRENLSLPEINTADFDGDGRSDKIAQMFLTWTKETGWSDRWYAASFRRGNRLIEMRFDGSILEWHRQDSQADQLSVYNPAFADVDGDGRIDLIVRRNFGRDAELFWHRNITGGDPFASADLNHDGRVDGADLGELFVQWTG